MEIKSVMLVTSRDKGQENMGERRGSGRTQVHLNVTVNESAECKIES